MRALPLTHLPLSLRHPRHPHTPSSAGYGRLFLASFLPSTASVRSRHLGSSAWGRSVWSFAPRRGRPHAHAERTRGLRLRWGWGRGAWLAALFPPVCALLTRTRTCTTFLSGVARASECILTLPPPPLVLPAPAHPPPRTLLVAGCPRPRPHASHAPPSHPPHPPSRSPSPRLRSRYKQPHHRLLRGAGRLGIRAAVRQRHAHAGNGRRNTRQRCDRGPRWRAAAGWGWGWVHADGRTAPQEQRGDEQGGCEGGRGGKRGRRRSRAGEGGGPANRRNEVSARMRSGWTEKSGEAYLKFASNARVLERLTVLITTGASAGARAGFFAHRTSRRAPEAEDVCRRE
ncbi:hypothetical protein B0H14DRAFT_66467 [Mycena olivaceomarginata]|nr:hypothetical protein B0H14DRAFT_66467 [Mycena olivaceomarginata]